MSAAVVAGVGSGVGLGVDSGVGAGVGEGVGTGVGTGVCSGTEGGAFKEGSPPVGKEDMFPFSRGKKITKASSTNSRPAKTSNHQGLDRKSVV